MTDSLYCPLEKYPCPCSRCFAALAWGELWVHPRPNSPPHTRVRHTLPAITERIISLSRFHIEMKPLHLATTPPDDLCLKIHFSPTLISTGNWGRAVLKSTSDIPLLSQDFYLSSIQHNHITLSVARKHLTGCSSLSRSLQMLTSSPLSRTSSAAYLSWLKSRARARAFYSLCNLTSVRHVSQ